MTDLQVLTVALVIALPVSAIILGSLINGGIGELRSQMAKDAERIEAAIARGRSDHR
jgi:hypothetical protein